MNIKAIETVYKGYRFRSRLEARWAVFFDHLREPWEYEPQGYEWPGGRYLPDFHLPQRSLLVEIKPGTASAEEAERVFRKPYSFAVDTRRELLIISGQPWPGEYKLMHFRPHGFGMELVIGEFAGDPGMSELVLATRAELDQPAKVREALMVVGHIHHDGVYDSSGERPEGCRRPDGIGQGLLNEAFRSARGARFEHGEAGAPAPAPPVPPPVVAPPAAPAPVAPWVAKPLSPKPATPAPVFTLEGVQACWPAVLETVRCASVSTAALLRGGIPAAVEPPVSGSWSPPRPGGPPTVVLEIGSAWHREKLLEPANRVAVEKALRRVLGRATRFKCLPTVEATP